MSGLSDKQEGSALLLTRRAMLFSGCAFVAGCGGDGGGSAPSPPPPVVRVPFSFANGTDGFTADFADYAPGQEIGDQGIRFLSGIRRVPAPLNARTGLLVAGTNRSDDLFMYIWRPITGLVPGQRYRVAVEFTFATNVPPDCVGVGGSPGEGVTLKAGAAAREPAKSVQSNLVLTNIDKANQRQSGREAIVVGTFAGGGGTCSSGTYRLKTVSTASPEQNPPPEPLSPGALLVTADGAGRLWIVIGTDSGFEARTEIYYLEGVATFTPL